MLSVLIPTANNASDLAILMRDLVAAAVDGLARQVIVIDAAPDDETQALCRDTGADLVRDGLGRAAEAARADLILVAPAQLRLSDSWRERLLAALAGGVREGRLLGVRAGGVAGLVRPRAFAILASRGAVIAAGDFAGLSRCVRGPRIG